MKGIILFALVLTISVSCYSLGISKDHLPGQKISKGVTEDHNPITIKYETRQKRSRRDLNEIKDIDDVIENLEENSIIPSWPSTEIDIENMHPRAFYLLVQKIKQLQNNDPYRVRTPRLGRNYDVEFADDQQNSRLLKKSVPFKPRLGKRTNSCE